MNQGSQTNSPDLVPRVQKSLKISHFKSMIVLGLILLMTYVLTKPAKDHQTPSYKVRTITLLS